MHIEFVPRKWIYSIPWAKLVADPGAWIEPKSYPPRFQWADPSKIQKEAVHEIFNHWRHQKASRLAPIIWNPSCDVLVDVDQPYKYLQTTVKHRRDANSSDSSIGENFRKELEGIPEDDQESNHSPSLTPPPARAGPSHIIRP